MVMAIQKDARDAIDNIHRCKKAPKRPPPSSAKPRQTRSDMTSCESQKGMILACARLMTDERYGYDSFD